jgi:hypothetical protein
MYILTLTKNVWVTFWAIFFTNSSGHPAFGGKQKLMLRGFVQGCQMVYFQTKNPNLGKFCRGKSWYIL